MDPNGNSTRSMLLEGVLFNQFANAAAASLTQNHHIEQMIRMKEEAERLAKESKKQQYEQAFNKDELMRLVQQQEIRNSYGVDSSSASYGGSSSSSTGTDAPNVPAAFARMRAGTRVKGPLPLLGQANASESVGTGNIATIVTSAQNSAPQGEGPREIEEHCANQRKVEGASASKAAVDKVLERAQLAAKAAAQARAMASTDAAAAAAVSALTGEASTALKSTPRSRGDDTPLVFAAGRSPPRREEEARRSRSRSRSLRSKRQAASRSPSPLPRRNGSVRERSPLRRKRESSRDRVQHRRSRSSSRQRQRSRSPPAPPGPHAPAAKRFQAALGGLAPQLAATKKPPASLPALATNITTGAAQERKRRGIWDLSAGATFAAMQKVVSGPDRPPTLQVTTTGGVNHKVIRLPAVQIRALLGRGGQTINDIRIRSGADIKIHHPPHEEYGCVAIVGNIERVEKLMSEALITNLGLSVG